MGGRRGHKRKQHSNDTADSNTPADLEANMEEERTADTTANGNFMAESTPIAPGQAPLPDVSGDIAEAGATKDSVQGATNSTGGGRKRGIPKRAQTQQDRVAVKRQRREEYRANLEQGEHKGIVELPKKRFYRQRAHANPFSDHALDYPTSPQDMDWSAHFPDYVFRAGDPEVEDGSRRPGQLKKNIDVADIGCGFGGLLFALAPRMPGSLILGLEIRVSVTEFVHNKIKAVRHQVAQGITPSLTDAAPPPPEPPVENTTNDTPTTTPSTSTQPPADPSTTSIPPDGPLHPSFPPPPPTNHLPSYKNISTHRTNTMKFLPNFFPRASLSSIFLCFPDPHFKARKHKARIVSPALLAEYWFVLREGGRVYTITDVEDLAVWMAGCFERGMGWRRVGMKEWEGLEVGGDVAAEKEDGKMEGDWRVGVMWGETEEGMKVTRNKGRRWVSVWEKLAAPEWPSSS